MGTATTVTDGETRESAESPVLRVGAPMWTHADWVGRVMPAAARGGGELAWYASWCNAVEGNTTFYALPRAATVERWARLAPGDFRFVFKLPRAITHERRLRDAGGLVREFCDLLEPLGPRLGPTSIQLPASFGPVDLPVLGAFLDQLPRGRRWAVEVRHPEFFDGGGYDRALSDLLFEHDVERIVLDSRALFAGPVTTPEEIETRDRKPRVPVRPVAIGAEPIVRFIGQTDPDANPAFWAPWVAKVVDWLGAGRSPIVFLHTPDNVAAPDQARRFHAEVASQVPDLTPLPTPTPFALF